MRDLEISVTQAATLLISSGKTVVNYCNKGLLKGTKNPVTGVWKVSLASVNKLIRGKAKGIRKKNKNEKIQL